MENEIALADARRLAEYVKPDSVALTVTSPPYRNAIDYSQHVANMSGPADVWMRGTGLATTADYLDTMQRIFDQVLHVTREGGLCCIVIGDEVVDGKLVPLPSLLLSRLASCENEDDIGRWRLRDVIIWHKVTSGRNGSGNRCGLLIKMPYPGYFRANIMHEYILVLQKGRPGRGIAGAGAERIPLNRIVKRELANSIWNIPPVPPRTVRHPVPFPEQIPWRLITLFTKRGDMVMDPMNGSGQTTKVARSMGRRYLGFDTVEEYVAEARERLRQETRLSDYLIPVYYKESWSKDVQAGFFETTEVDLSPNVPGSYKLLGTEYEDSTRGQPESYVYYRNAGSQYICFIITATGRQYRLNLGGTEDDGSMMRRIALGMPVGEFAESDLGGILETGIAGRKRPVRACIGALLHSGHVELVDGDGQKRRYRLTPAGARLQGEAGED